MLRRMLTLTLALGSLFLSPAAASAQSVPAPQARTEEPAARPAHAPDFVAEAERAAAVALLSSLADEARDYKDPALRVRVQARAADALWAHDRERARALFRRAWGDAEEADKEGMRRAEEARREFLAGVRRGSGMIPPPPQLRAEILRLVSPRSRELGEELLARLGEEKGRDGKEPAAPEIADPTEPPYAVAQRLELARQLLESGDVERAMQFAEPALRRTTSQGIIFLSALRQLRPAAADEKYAALLRAAAADPSADAAAVALLSSYLFSPSVVVTATRNGRLSNQWAAGPLPPPDVAPALRETFFRVAEQILLRPLPPPDQDRTAAGRAGTYFTLARLIPIFDQHAPDRAPALRALLASLSGDAPEPYRADREGMLTLGLTPASATGADPQEIIGQLTSASTAYERDGAYARAARVAALKGDVRAQEYAEKIENENLRKRVLAFVQFAALSDALKRRNAEEASRLARAGDFQPLQRVWAYTEAARLLAVTHPARAAELLEEAAAEARRLEDGTAARAYALTAVAARLFEADRQRGWELAAEAVKAANKAVGFTGEENRVEARLNTSDNVATLKADAPAFNPSAVFAALAKDDLLRAVALAKTFEGELPRASALIAVARATLERERAAGPR